jgi:hypothetical protein
VEGKKRWHEKERCEVNGKKSWALNPLTLLPLALLMAACALTSPNKLDGNPPLASEGGTTIQSKEIDVTTKNGGDSHSFDAADQSKEVDVTTNNTGDGHSLDAADGNPTDALFVTNNGSVGIGTVAPSERLSVSGTVESTRGGFKFPDGTIQTTAAKSKYQRIIRWKSGGVLTLKPGQSKYVIARCPKGMKALGGGGGFRQHDGPIAIIASHSKSKGTQWIVVIKNMGTENGSADLFSEVMCTTMD